MNGLTTDIPGLSPTRRIEDAVEDLLLPSHGVMVSALLETVEHTSPDIDAAVRVIMADPALLIRFLLISSESPSHSASFDIPTLIRRTPLRLLRVIATALAIQDFQTRFREEKHHDLSGFIAHSLAVAHLCRLLAVESGYGDPMEAYCTGLLHDIGELVILSATGAGYGLLLGICSGEDELLSLEPQYTGTTHSEAGSLLVSRLGRNTFMPDALLFHHLPFDEIRHVDPLSRILWTAHSLTERGAAPPLPPGAHTILTGIPAARIDELRASIPRTVSDELERLGIAPPSRPSALPLVNHIPQDHTPLSGQKKMENALEASLTGMALLAPLQQSLLEWEEEPDLIAALSLSARFLFGCRRIFLFMWDRQTSLLAPLPQTDTGTVLARLTLDPDGPSTPARSFSSGCPLSSFDHLPPSIVDRQIIRALGSDGFLSLPVDGGEEMRGTLVLPLSARQHARGEKLLPLMKSFASVTASTLSSLVRLRNRERERETILREDFLRHVRRVKHEASNPLGIINQYLAILTETIGDRAPVGNELNVLKEEIQRIGSILGQIGELPREVSPKNLIPLNGVIEGMLALYAESLFTASGIAVRTDLSPDITGIRGEKDKLKQILLNLWKNASEAMSGGGEIGIVTRQLSGEGGARFIELTIEDTGPGLPSDVASRLFTPLEPGRKGSGGGVGLSIVASLVRELGGTIYCHTAQGRGTRFVILFPVD